MIYTGGGGSHPPSNRGGSEPLLDPAASTSAAAAAVAASPASQVDTGGVVLRRGETVVRCVGAALSHLCGRGTTLVHLSWFLPAGADGVEELDVIGGCPPLLSESQTTSYMSCFFLSMLWGWGERDKSWYVKKAEVHISVTIML